MMYYKNQAFYSRPMDGVAEVSDADYAELLAKQAQGWQIIDGEDGRPQAVPPQPSAAHSWNGSGWELDTAAAAALKAEQQEQMWERIKERRRCAARAGVYVKTAGKWFHSDDDARQQYTFLRTVERLPENLQWKTMDNSFVPMTRKLLDELTLQLLADEQADFATAEKHRAAMLKADNPLDYDYSGGWTAACNEEAQS